MTSGQRVTPVLDDSHRRTAYYSGSQTSISHEGRDLAVLWCLATMSASGSSVETTLCELVNHPSRFANTDVRIRAVVMSDLIEHTMLVDGGCLRGIALWIPHELDDSANVQRLREELRRQWTEPSNETQVRAVFTGTFLHERRKLYLKVSSMEQPDVAPDVRLRPIDISLIHLPTGGGPSPPQRSPRHIIGPRRMRPGLRETILRRQSSSGTHLPLQNLAALQIAS